MTADPLRLLLLYWGRRGFPVRLVGALARHLSDRPDVALALSLSRQSEDFADIDPAIPSCHVDTFRSRATAAAALARVPRLRREMRRFSEAMGTEAAFVPMRHAFFPVVLPAMRRAGVRVLLAVHDALPHPGESYPLWRALFRLTLSATDGIAVMSEHVGELMRRAYGYPEERIFRMPLAAPETGRIRGPRRAPDGRPWRLAFLGRIREYKGLELLAEAYPELRRRFPVTLRVVGEGHSRALATLSALPDVAIEQRWVPEREWSALFDAADVLVLPYAEASQSGVLAIAQALGLPAVATPVGGLREQLRSGATGVLAAEATAPALVDALATLLGDPALYARCSSGALASAAGIPRAADSLLEALRTLRAMPLR